MTMYLLVSEKIYANLSKYREKIYAKTKKLLGKLKNKSSQFISFIFFSDELATSAGAAGGS